MLEFTNIQIEAFKASQRRRDLDRFAAQLRDDFDDHCAKWSDADLLGLVIEQLNVARRYGIFLPEDQMRWLVFAVKWAAGFDADPERPWCVRILTRSSRTGQQKLDALQNYADGLDRGSIA